MMGSRAAAATLAALVALVALQGALAEHHLKARCLNDCSGRGDCMQGVCVCQSLYSGADCSIEAEYHDKVYEPLPVDMSRPAPEEPLVLKVCLVSTEVVGPVSNGGIGTAFTTLAFALKKAGHQVTIVFTMGAVSQFGPFEDHKRAYWEQGIELIGLWRSPVRYISRHMLESYEVMRYLRENAFDVVHFHDYQGAGYYAMLAKQQGLYLQDTLTIVGTHGPNLWAKAVGNQETIDRIGDLEMDYMERKILEMADYVVSPSQYILNWMGRENWPPRPKERTYVQPNILPLADRRPASSPRPEGRAPAGAVRELVFFARLETRKGVITFCDAIERILDPTREPHIPIGEGGLERVTFLGRGAMVLGKFGVQYVQERAQKWNVPWKVISRMGPVEAKAYLREGPRLAVIPSRIENSPYTVYECAELGIPFIASDVGGVKDLIHPEDHTHALFDATEDALVDRLALALKEGVSPARPIVDAYGNEDIWMRWHQQVVAEFRERREREKAEDEARELPFVSVVMTHYKRPALCWQALESLEVQDYPKDKFEVILIDDGSPDDESKAFLDRIEGPFAEKGWTLLREQNRYLGAARNFAFKRAKGKYVLFMDDDNYAKPHEIRTYSRAMEHSGADVLTSFVDFFWSTEKPTEKEMTMDRPSYLFLGGSSDVGAFKNCFGDANSFVRVSSFEAIGGYTEDYGVGFEDWEMYANASLRGFKVDIIPESVYNYRFTKGSMQKTTDYFRNRRRSLRPYLNSLPQSLHHVILSAVFPRKSDGSIGKPTGLAAQGDSKFAGVANSQGEASPEAVTTTGAAPRPPPTAAGDAGTLPTPPAPPRSDRTEL